MKKREIQEVLKDCVEKRGLCRLRFSYDFNSRYYFPLEINEKLFLATEENDFTLNGYSVRRVKDVVSAEHVEDMHAHILKEEGIVASIQMPKVELASWETVFRDLKQKRETVIVEKEDLEEGDTRYIFGSIEKVEKLFCVIRRIDEDGAWQEQPLRVLYAEITGVTFDSRYVHFFSKYMDEFDLQ